MTPTACRRLVGKLFKNNNALIYIKNNNNNALIYIKNNNNNALGFSAPGKALYV
jgi:hypothetical protein